ncbi:MAG: NADase-type glycan-binding domain-containing protein [Thermodesulfobacteriota bacterium]
MKLFTLLLLLAAACPAWGKGPEVSTPLAFQIDAAAAPEPGANLSRLVDAANTAGVPAGEWIRFDFGKRTTVTAMTIVNGWAAGHAFRENARIKTARLDFQDGSSRTVHLKDTPKEQTIAVQGGGRSVKLTVEEVYPGTRGQTPYISRIGFLGFDPSRVQVTLTGHFEGCVRSRSSSTWEGGEDPLYYCVRFKADDGKTYGCQDDLCFHPKQMVNVRLKVTGFIKDGDILEVLEATPAP